MALLEQEKEQLRKLIDNNDFSKLIDFVNNLPLNKEGIKVFMIVKNQYKQLKSRQTIGSLEQEEKQILHSDINYRLLTFVDELELYYDSSQQKDIPTSTVEILLEGEISQFTQEKRRILVDTIAVILNIKSSKISIKRVIAGVLRCY